MSAASIAAQRLHNQRIAEPAAAAPDEVVAWLGALQGQDYAGAKWSIGMRTPGSTDAAVEQAISDNRIARTWLMRGTLHMVAAADLRWLVELVAPRLTARNKTRYRQLELDHDTLMRSNSVLETALQGGKQLDRRTLLAILEDNGISTAGQRGVYMLQRASLDGLIFQGSALKNVPTFMRIDDRLPQASPLPRGEALAELARRYFTARGPATLADFAYWAGLTVKDARDGLEAVKAELVADRIGDADYWRSAATSAPAQPPAAVYLPPGFDEYLLGYKDRDAVLDAEHAQKVCPGKNGVFYPTILVDGRMVAIWKRTLKKDSVVIEHTPFDTALTAEQHEAFTSAARAFSDFLGLSLVLND